MTREAEVVAYLAADGTLGTLAPGGVYADADLGEEGITDDDLTPDVWEGGTFQATVIVRERAPAATGQLSDLRLQVADYNQAIEIHIYGLAAEDVQAISNRAYALMQGHRFDSAWPAEWVPGAPLEQALELPPGIKTQRDEYRIRALRRAA